MDNLKQNNLKTLNAIQKLILFLLFAAFALIGLLIADDYGVPWDDHLQYQIGKQNYEYAIGENQDIFKSADQHYGSAFELPLYIIQKQFTSYQNQIFVRHLVTHFYFLFALFFFFLLLLRLFKNYQYAILGLIFLYLSPRIFADSFYNTKDIPFLSTFIISLYSLIILIESPSSLKRLSIHAFVSAFLIDIRIIGFIAPIITISLFFFHYIAQRGFRKTLKPMGIYLLLTLVMIYALWPALWPNPAVHFMQTMARMSHFPWNYSTLFMGEMVKAFHNPWYYVPWWLGITSPLIIIIFYLFGLVALIQHFIKNVETGITKHQWSVFIFALFPIDLWILFLILKPTFYDGWRHLYFFAPLIIIGAVYGVRQFLRLLRKQKKATIILSIFSVSIAFFPAIQMLILHPYQQTYFNGLVNKSEEYIRQHYEFDYWGLSFKEGMEAILKIDDRATILVYISNESGIDNWRLVNEKDPRIKLVERLEDANYFISNYRFHPEDYAYPEVYSLSRQGSKILSVFKLDDYEARAKE